MGEIGLNFIILKHKVMDLINNKDLEDSLKSLDIHTVIKGNKKHDYRGGNVIINDSTKNDIEFYSM